MPQLWSALFFFMLWTLGLDSSMCLIDSATSFIIDSYPEKFQTKRTLVTLVFCIVCFLISVPLACDNARCALSHLMTSFITVLLSHIVDLIDHYYAGPTLIYIVFLEVVMIAVFYGVPTFINDLVEITRSEALGRLRPLFYIVYYFLTPAALAGVRSLISFVENVPPQD